LHRVRVGPYGTESEANGIVSRLQTQVGDIKPRVMDLQPEKVAQVTKPADPLVRWVVQVGSFSSAANADKLVARLRLDSMTAYKEEVSRSGSGFDNLPGAGWPVPGTRRSNQGRQTGDGAHVH